MTERSSRNAPAGAGAGRATPTRSTRARLVLDEAWIAWPSDRNEEMAEPAQRGLELARKLDDADAALGALDAVSASAWGEGRYGEAIEHNRERLESSRRRRATRRSAIERSDALHMMVESLVQGRLPGRTRSTRPRPASCDLARGAVVLGWARRLLPAFFLGEWDSVLAMGERVRRRGRRWTDPRRGVRRGLARPARCSATGATTGARRIGSTSPRQHRVEAAAGGQGCGMLAPDVALHRGASWRRERPGADRAGLFWWQAPLHRRAAPRRPSRRREDVAEALPGRGRGRRQPVRARDGPRRARALHDEDEASLREALAVSRRSSARSRPPAPAGCSGGDDRAEAESTFERLGATPPVS